MSPPAAGVATRRFAHFFTSPGGQSAACKGIAQLKKTQDPLSICYLFLEERSKTLILSCGINRKCLVFRLEFFLFAVLFEEHATDTDRLRKRVRWREKRCFIMNFIRSLSLPHQKRASGGNGRGLSLKEICFMKKEKTGLKPVFLPFATFVSRKQ